MVQINNIAMLMLPRTVAAALTIWNFCPLLCLQECCSVLYFMHEGGSPGWSTVKFFFNCLFSFLLHMQSCKVIFLLPWIRVSISIFFTRNAWCKCTCKRNHVHIVQETRRLTRRPCAFPTLTTRTTYVHYITNDIFHVVHVQ